MSSGGGGDIAAADQVGEDNTYYVQAMRLRFPPGATGAAADLETARKYFEAQGWTVTQLDDRKAHTLVSTTGNGFQVVYVARTNGQYSLSVSSELYWTNSFRELFRAVARRAARTFPPKSKPGVFVRFPKGSDPVVEPSLWCRAAGAGCGHGKSGIPDTTHR